MAITVKQFVSEDEYEEWIERSGHAIEVLDIQRASSANGSRRSLTKGRVKGAVLIKYRTTDRSLLRNRSTMAIRLALFALVALVVCVYAMRNQAPIVAVKLLKLDK